ncbi:MAG: GHMP kinase [Candidatus Didemnitutus sp.]|nr:GHMP kinase [Candidatus Didemnitutus sp.]
MSTIHRSRAPLRLGLAGGGTDVSPYSDEFGGRVLNATINLHSYCSLIPAQDGRVHFAATDRHETFAAAAVAELPLDGALPLHKAVYNRVVRQFNGGRPLPCRLVTYSDAPAGSGLGTSSTMTVAILGAFAEWLKLPLGEYELAHTAFEIERLELQLAGGKQDQYAAAFGGFNFMEFHAGDRVIVNPLRIRASTRNELQSSLLLYYTGVSRDSATIISEQIRNVHAKSADSVNAMHRLKAEAIQMKEDLLRGDLISFAQVLGRSWLSKKAMAHAISNASIEAVFAAAHAAGALSGKVSGAGGGGFIMFMIDPCRREEVTHALAAFPGALQRFQFTETGVETWTVRPPHSH